MCSRRDCDGPRHARAVKDSCPVGGPHGQRIGRSMRRDRPPSDPHSLARKDRHGLPHLAPAGAPAGEDRGAVRRHRRPVHRRGDAGRGVPRHQTGSRSDRSRCPGAGPADWIAIAAMGSPSDRSGVGAAMTQLSAGSPSRPCWLAAEASPGGRRCPRSGPRPWRRLPRRRPAPSLRPRTQFGAIGSSQGGS